MKPLTTQELKAAKKTAYAFIYGIENVLLNKRFRYDARTRIGNAAAAIVRQNKDKVDKRAIMELKRKRAVNKANNTTNYLTNKLVIDFVKHRREVVKIFSDKILFISGRNHWAKNSVDTAILTVLKKHYA